MVLSAGGVGGQAEYGDLYTQQNVAISGIHTHSGPAGYLQYLLYDITSMGFVRETFDVIVNGIVEVPRAAPCRLCTIQCFRASRPKTLKAIHPML